MFLAKNNSFINSNSSVNINVNRRYMKFLQY